jgi:nitrite reductase/ring-hydroxylating ferredoxin subunit
MSPRKAKSRKPTRPSGAIRGLIFAAGICATAVAGMMSASLFLHNQGQQAGGAGLCPHFDIDQKTGNVRDKGSIPCDQLSMQNSRFDLIRDSFKGR